MRASLVAALESCAEGPGRAQAECFLAGLSSDELQFIAEFLGACLLESARDRCVSRAEVADRIARYQEARTPACCSADQEHKMILLLEYLCRCGLLRFPLPARAAGQCS